MDTKIRNAIENSIKHKSIEKKLSMVMPFVPILFMFGLYKMKFTSRIKLDEVVIVFTMFGIFSAFMYYKACRVINFLKDPEIIEYRGIIKRKRSGKNYKYYDDKTLIEYEGGPIDLDEYIDKEVFAMVENQSKTFLIIEELFVNNN